MAFEAHAFRVKNTVSQLRFIDKSVTIVSGFILNGEALQDDILLTGKPVLNKDLLAVYHDGRALLPRRFLG